VLEYLDLSLPPILVSIKNSIPKGSGLGGSSLLAATILSALMAYSLGAEYVVEHPGLITNAVLMIEQMIGSGGGWQDQIGGMVPGIKLIETNPKNCTTYKISYLNDLVADELSAHSLILNTGIRRRATNVLEPIRELYLKKDKKALVMLAEIRELAKTSFKHLESVAIKDFAETLTISWNKVVEVENKSSIPLVREIMELCGDDLLGFKIAGAGGGGFAILVFVSEEARNYNELKIQNEIPHGTVYRPIFGRYGMAIIQDGKTFRVKRKEKI
jgi:galactokinase/mevalonate kinase-like predicted kinase